MWRPGIEISTWPELKFAKAVQHLHQLWSQIAMWHAAAPITTDKNLSEDGLTATVVLRVRPEPPIREWGLTLGDTIHNLRSALDALVWELAHVDGASPAHPTQVQFSVTTTEKAWSRAASSLSSLPAAALDRIHQMQPVCFPDALGKTALELLAKLSNLDKHRSPIEATIAGAAVEFRNVSLTFESEEAAEAAGAPKTEVALGDLKDGATLVRIEAPTRIVALQAPMLLTPEFQLVIDSERHNLEQTINVLMGQVRAVMDFVYRGPAVEPQPDDDEGWSAHDNIEVKDSLD